MKMHIVIESDTGVPLLTHQHVELLMAVQSMGSITSGAKMVGLSYKHAWDTLSLINSRFAHSLTSTEIGGVEGGGTRVTEFGNTVIQHYWDAANKASAAALPALTELRALIKEESSDATD